MKTERITISWPVTGVFAPDLAEECPKLADLTRSEGGKSLIEAVNNFNNANAIRRELSPDELGSVTMTVIFNHARLTHPLKKHFERLNVLLRFVVFWIHCVSCGGRAGVRQHRRAGGQVGGQRAPG